MEMNVAPIGMSYIPIPAVPPLNSGDNPESGITSFGDMLNNAIKEVNDKKVKADELTLGFLTGEVQDFHTVAIAMQESSITTSLAIEVRNKLLEAYQEVSRMQV
jgi:flagellar hook-basal body complex protein FliE